MAWRRIGDKPLREPRWPISLAHICVTRLQWVKEVSLLFQRVIPDFRSSNDTELNYLMTQGHGILNTNNTDKTVWLSYGQLVVTILEKEPWLVTMFGLGNPNVPIFAIADGAIGFQDYRPVTWLRNTHTLQTATQSLEFNWNVNASATPWCVESVIAAVFNGRTLGNVVFLHVHFNTYAHPVRNMCYVTWKQNYICIQ